MVRRLLYFEERSMTTRHRGPRRVFVKGFLAMGNAIRPASKTTNTSRRDTASAVSASPHRLKKTHRLEHRPPFDSVALLLQGGGALGAYQAAGVYEALAEADLHPDWVAGTSRSGRSTPPSSSAIPGRHASPSCANSGNSSASLPSVSTATSPPCCQKVMPRAPWPNT